MGLGTKIKEALSGDKDKDKHAIKRRQAPGAYPESMVSIPRTNTTNTVRTKSNRPIQETKAEDIQEEKDFNEYTHRPAGVADHDTVSPLSDEEDADGYLASSGPRNSVGHADKAPAKQQQQQQYPYWGDVGKSGTNGVAAAAPNGTGFSDNDSGIAGKNSIEHQADSRGISAGEGYHSSQSGRGDYDQYMQQNHANGAGSSSNNTHPALRGGANSGAFNLPTGSVNRGRPTLVDDDAAMVNSMVASQVSGPSVAANGADYSPGQDRNVHMNGAAWGDQQQQQQQQYVRPGDPTTSFKSRAALGHGYPEQQQHPVEKMDRTVSPINTNNYSNGNSSNGSTPVKPGAASAGGGDHYGPGHAGARVLHQCQHCGHDNDITRYFSKDVVYRLS